MEITIQITRISQREIPRTHTLIVARAGAVPAEPFRWRMTRDYAILSDRKLMTGN